MILLASLFLDFPFSINRGPLSEDSNQQTEMISQILFTAMMLLIQSISALNILNVPTGTIWNPCSTYGITLDGNGIGPGSNVRVELWDNVDGEDVETAVLAKSVIVNDSNSVSVTIPCDYPKSRNAFLRVYYRDHNAVSGRIYIRKNEISSKTCTKPTITPTCVPTMMPTATPAPGSVVYACPGAIIHNGNQPAAGAVLHPGPGAIIYTSSQTSSASTTTVVPTTTSTISRSMSTSVTSTSSATTAKYSVGSIALALAIALSTLLF